MPFENKKNNLLLCFMKTITLLSALLMGATHAELITLDNDSLSTIDAQGGAEMSQLMQLNHMAWVDATASSAPTLVCSDIRYCRLAMTLNNRNHDGTVTGSSTGKKLWLVFKGMQGTIFTQYVQLTGSDISYTADDGISTEWKAAITFTYDPERPILIRNYGFNALAIETDTVANEGTSNLPGYLAQASGTGYTNGKYTAAGFDNGRETGFTGLMYNGNMVLNGSIKMFGCSTNHPRC